MLLPKSMAITNVFRVHYETSMGRDALFVDINIDGKTVRLCTTHLESFPEGSSKRRGQLAIAAEYLHQTDVGILGGDLNALKDIDKSLHTENQLKDAYLKTGQVEGSKEGMTWGQMAAIYERHHGLSRVDKLLFCGAIQVEDFETFGMDVEVEDEADKQQLIKTGLEKGWVTDHLGINANFTLSSLPTEPWSIAGKSKKSNRRL